MPIRRADGQATGGNTTVRRKRGIAPEMQVTSETLGPPIEERFTEEHPSSLAEGKKIADATTPPAGRSDESAEKAGLTRDIANLEMDNGFAEVVKNFFHIENPRTEAEELRKFLKGAMKPSRMSYGEAADELGEAQENAMRGAELLGTAKITHERFEFDAGLIEATMREKAQKEIEGERTTKPTIADIEARMKKMFPDQLKALLVAKRENKEALALFEALAFRLAERARDLRQILARVQRPGDL